MARRVEGIWLGLVDRPGVPLRRGTFKAAPDTGAAFPRAVLSLPPSLPCHDAIYLVFSYSFFSSLVFDVSYPLRSSVFGLTAP
ncbi:hypothetical protein E2C01_012109 [Portunus trituberculatus]|uniref:Uncharacterized protein n=1 Tax=Portunus trituberculatus TaxID=210409 RepID=A0A5B7DD29_PORTR|nr:hypothetical protein [Portunus trituberculatus]